MSIELENLPPAPVNIRLVAGDEREIPVDSHYVGTNDEGVAMWNVLIPPDLDYHSMKIAVLPGKTSVQVIRDYTT